MKQIKRPISFLLLLVFCCLSIKSFMVGYIQNSLSNCQEFAHIHIYKLSDKTSAQFSTASINQKMSSSAEGCHEGKFIWTHSLFPKFQFSFSRPEYKISFSLNFNFQNHFNSPYLEPRLRPPRKTPVV